jgi:hypothetical protein
MRFDQEPNLAVKNLPVKDKFIFPFFDILTRSSLQTWPVYDTSPFKTGFFPGEGVPVDLSKLDAMTLPAWG